MKEHAGSANGAAKCTRSIPSPRPTASSNGTDDATGNIGAMRSAAREPGPEQLWVAAYLPTPVAWPNGGGWGGGNQG